MMHFFDSLRSVRFTDRSNNSTLKCGVCTCPALPQHFLPLFPYFALLCYYITFLLALKGRGINPKRLIIFLACLKI
ncbi:MAG: hypothetical protein LBR79_06275 [Oscillospiraceae bacterium]|nr:hypothetical protein [Oscillospiraceae bacterium]